MDTIPLDTPLRQCPKCKQYKFATLEFFYPLRTDSPKFKATCRECIKEIALLRYHQKPKKYHHAKLGATTKACSKCHLEKPLHHFNKDKHAGILKRNSECKLCQYALNPEKYIQGTLPLIKKCRKCHLEKNIEEFYSHKQKSGKGDGFSRFCRICTKADNHHRRQEHLEERREKDHFYHAARAEAIAAGKIKPLPRRDHALMIVCEQGNRYRAKAMGVERVEVVDYVRIYERDKNFCYICEGTILRQHRIAFDHVIPLTRGGAHAEDNIRLTHFLCNGRKSDNLLHEMTSFQRRGP